MGRALPVEAIKGGKYFEARLELGSKLNSVSYWFQLRVRETESMLTQVFVLPRM